MRQSKLTVEEIEAAAEVADKQKKTRTTGFDMMTIRDRGYAILSNGAKVVWPIKEVWSEEVNGVQTKASSIPAGTFMINGVLFDMDELQKFIRWA